MAEHHHRHHHHGSGPAHHRGAHSVAAPEAALIGASHAAALGPTFSLLRLSLAARLAVAAVLTAFVWLAVYWATT